MTIGKRLKEERERLGMTIPELAEAAGAKKNTVIDWQKDLSSPPATKLAALAAIGADVLYVLTGQKLRDDQKSHFDLAVQATLTANQSEEDREQQLKLLQAAQRQTAALNAKRDKRYRALLRLLDDCSDESLDLIESTAKRLREADLHKPKEVK